MRITKKFIREAKRSLSIRMKQLSSMSFDELLIEVNRMFPEAKLTPDLSKDSFREYGALLNQAMQWAFESQYPSHICE